MLSFCVLTFALCLLPFLSACQRRANSTKAAEPAAVQVSWTKVKTEAFAITVPITGTLVSTVQVEVKAEIIGRVARFPKEEGDPVAAGETVVWLDEENYRLSLRQAETAVGVAEAALEKARVLEAHSQSESERARNLLQSGGITDKDLKAAETAERDARAQVAFAAAQLAQARAALEVARKKLRDCHIRAPVSGQIQKKSVKPGSFVEAPTPVFTIVNNRKLELESPVASADLGSVSPGQRVAFSVNTYPGEKFEGRVLEILPALDTQTRSAKVRVGVDNSGGRLKAGTFAQGEIVTGIQAQAIVIPAAAVYREDHTARETYVFVANGGKAVRRKVRVGRETGGNLEIVEGLREGELLITEQSLELAEGVRVAERK